MPSFNHIAARQGIADKGLSIAETARRLNPPMDRAVLSNILNGNRKGSLELAVRIAAVTGDAPYSYIGPDEPLEAAIAVARKAIEVARAMGATDDDLFGDES